MEREFIFRGKNFTQEEISKIKKISDQHWNDGRSKISRVICETIHWYQPNLRLKDVACREALRKMEEKGVVKLPPKKIHVPKRKIKKLHAKDVGFKEPKKLIIGKLRKTNKIHFELAETPEEQKLWQYLIQEYHYLGYKQIVGRYLKYLVCLDMELVALLGFGDGIYHHNLRDKWLGWNKEMQEKNRHLIIDNVRFLILPWVRVKNLASRILSLSARIVPEDWNDKYGYTPLFLETFVDRNKFIGTSYKAANWICLGETKGKGRSGDKYFFHGITQIPQTISWDFRRNSLLMKGLDEI